jgi:hypothetical protein
MVTLMETEQSDQLPESGPEEYTEEDTAGPSKGESTENAGGSDKGDSDPDQATGNPANAG